MRLLAALLLCKVLLFEASLASGATPELPEALPRPQAAPKRIISLMPALTETVCLLGGCAHLVATDRHSDWPVSVQSLPKLGALDDTSLEAVIQLKPDLVLAHPGGRLNERLKSLGYRVLELRSDNLQDLRHALMEVEGQLKIAQSPRALRLWEEAQHAIQAQAKTLKLGTKPKVYIEVDSALYAAGPKSYLGELLTALGALNIVPSEFAAYPKLAPEFVLKQQPDVIMQMHSGPSFAQRPGGSALHAIQKKRLCQWSAEKLNILVRPGPRVGEASALMAACLRKFERAN